MAEYYEYYYNLSTAYFISDSKSMFMDGNLYTLDHSTKAAGREILVSLDDLLKIYGPYMEATRDGKKLHITLKNAACDVQVGDDQLYVNGENKPLAANVVEENGVVYIPVGSFMGSGFGKAVLNSLDSTMITKRQWNQKSFIVAVCEPFQDKQQPGTTVVVSMPRDKYEFDLEQVSNINRMFNGRENGVIGRAFWFEPAKKIQTYSAYIPFKYDPQKPSKMIVALHGGAVGEQFLYVFSRNQVQFWSEKFNYIFCCPNACTKSSTYGNLIDMGPFAGGELTNDPENPYNLGAEEVFRRKLGEKSVLATIEDICGLYNIDREHIYLQGNSMGGLGTFYLCAKYPEKFRACSPSGIGLDLRTIHLYEGIRKTPIRMVAGTEDGGFEKTKATYRYLKENGFDVEFEAIGGGVHFDAWTYVIEDTFKFYEKNA